MFFVRNELRTRKRFGKRFGSPISLVSWATEFDTSLSSSICQLASICRYRARGFSLFRGDKVKMVIELDDLSSSVTYRARFFQRRKKEKKMEVKAIMTHMEYKIQNAFSFSIRYGQKTLFCWSINVVLVFQKNIDKKTFFFTLSSFIYLMRDYSPSTARELNDLVLKRRPLTSLFFHARIVFI